MHSVTLTPYPNTYVILGSTRQWGVLRCVRVVNSAAARCGGFTIYYIQLFSRLNKLDARTRDGKAQDAADVLQNETWHPSMRKTCVGIEEWAIGPKFSVES